ncbi:MAG: ATP-dependent RNA helicase HrpA [Planctomycetaceae bacterium]|jgi:ATP-dependent helicase HrpA|nr:ATP-dependent RNA helicase HrpA [Planctomycetaceae bacterium]
MQKNTFSHNCFDIDFRRRLVGSLNLSFDSELPVSVCRDQISEAIQSNQVLVICGETGSGKSTQLPKICLEAGRGMKGIIGHTQPRRIAARSVAARIADELETELGNLVGYKVRFDEKTSQNILIKLMTDGILLAESQTDRRFNNYDTIIIDEAHERSLNIDFLLGMLKQILAVRNDLKLIITSATIDAQRFADHFSDRKINHGKPVPIIEVAGRNYPIEILYENYDDDNFDEAEVAAKLNLRELKSLSRDADIAEVSAIISAIDKLANHGTGDILVFLPTERDIIETKIILERHCIGGVGGVNRVGQTEVLPLYSRLPVSSQQQIFKKTSHRKIILATNVAESSITVPGIRYVVDTGKARISRYSAGTRTQRLPIEPISQASADQRAGRCGRIGAGICIRLYSEQDYLQRPRYTAPEILRTNLAAVILQTKFLKLVEIERFPFIDSPPVSAIADGYKTLFEIGAIDRQNNLTPIGLKLSRFPVDPRIGRMILAAEENDVLSEMLIIAAVLEIQDPRERPRDQQNKADSAHEQFLDLQSDFIGYLKLWDFYQNVKSKTSGASLRKACKQYFLSFNHMKEWNDIYEQLQNFTKECGMKISKRKKDFQAVYEQLHKSILTGNLSGIAERKTSVEYSTPAGSGGNSKFVIWLGSGIRKLSASKLNIRDQNNTDNYRNENSQPASQQQTALPNWLIANERIETERRYLRTVAKINPSWIEPLAKHLLKRVYTDAYWDRETGYVYAFEQVSLFGLVIVQRRRVNYGTIEPEIAGDIFLRQGLAAGEIDTDLEFVQYNKMVLDEVKQLQAKLRRADLLWTEDSMYEFYRSKIPSKLVYDKRTLEKWVKSTSPDNLLMSIDDICAERANAELFPDRIESVDSRSFDVDYKFAPSEPDDGVTLIIPREELRQVDKAQLGWLVPGLVEQKVIALLKSLSKDVRRQIVPIPDTAREILSRLDFGIGDLELRLAGEVSRLAGQPVTASDFKPELLPLELRMNIRVIGDNGEILGEGRDLDLLRREFSVGEVGGVCGVVAGGDSVWNRSGLTKWDFDDLPEFVLIDRGKTTIKAFPMISGNVLCLADSQDRAVSESRKGIVCLFYLLVKHEIRSQIKWFPDLDKLRIYSQPIPDFNFEDDVGKLVAARAFQIDDLPIPRSEGEYNSRVKNGESRLGVSLQEVVKVIAPLLCEFHGARLAIENVKNDRTREACAEAKGNLLRLVGGGFLLGTRWEMLREYPRFFKAAQIRMEKLRTGNDAIDNANMRELAEYWKRYEERLELHKSAGIIDPQLQLFRWMMEEYRVSLFAQQLGTSIKVSTQRLEKQFEKIK